MQQTEVNANICLEILVYHIFNICIYIVLCTYDYKYTTIYT